MEQTPPGEKIARALLFGLCALCASKAPGAPLNTPTRFDLHAPPGSSARYSVLPAEHGRPAPISSVRLTVGPTDRGQALRMELRRPDDQGREQTAIQIRLVWQDEKPGSRPGTTPWLRYQIWIPGTGEAYDYRNLHTDRALLPPWHEFERQFLPQPAPGTRHQKGFPETMLLLGHVLSLRQVEPAAPATVQPEYKTLQLDPELLIGTGRTFRDAQERRLVPGEKDYTFKPWTREDYAAMIDAGFNTFALIPGIESWLRAQPVFYRRGLKGDSALNWPVDFYRSNYRGESMYADEPACVMLRDKEISDGLLHFTDATEVIKARAWHEYERLSTRLGTQLRKSGISLGRLELRQSQLPVWETRYETAFYQLEAGFAGFVHEGRYHLTHFYESTNSFDEFVRWSTGLERHHTAEEMLEIHFAILRGAARHLQKDWGTSIYGQADPDIAPTAFRMAYDMGARYLWFWTSGPAHHVPWPEQLALARGVREHARSHPRLLLNGPQPILDRLVLIPYGYFLVLESPKNRRHDWDLWWIRDLDRTGAGEASQRYRRLMRKAFEQVHQALDRGESFDIAVDDGQPTPGYRSVVRIPAETDGPIRPANQP